MDYEDDAAEWTDEYLDELEGYLDVHYKKAEAYISEEWDKYLATMGAVLAVLWLAYQKAGDNKAEALKAYQKAAQEYNQRNLEYRRMVEETARRISNTNREAIDHINGSLPEVWRVNYNLAPAEGLLPGMHFEPISEDDLLRMMNAGEKNWQEQTLNFIKDMAWNTQMINNAILQGILQGQDIDTIARRIQDIVGMNWRSARRIARTMVTGAQNRGRQDRYEDLESQGLILHKIWVATPDHRTRNWHMSMDGQEVGIKESFVDGHGHELEYPGDPSAPPETVYNCRCTMYSEMVGVRRADGTIRYVSGHYGGSPMHDAQIAKERARREEN